MKIVIIGGVAGGATAAARIRRLNEEAEIVMFEKGKYISFAACGMPYYLGNVIKERDKLLMNSAQTFSVRYRVDVRTENEVVYIDRVQKTVTVRPPTGDIYIERYDKLLIATGAIPSLPKLEGAKLDGIFTLRNMNDTDRIKRYVEERIVRKALIVGAGFIGLEMAENLHRLGIKISIVEAANQVLTPIDFTMASMVHQQLMDKEVNLHLEQSVDAFERISNGIKVRLKSGLTLVVDMVILSVGVLPETTLARSSNIELGVTGGIKVNDRLQTSDPSIYAVGDVIEFVNPQSEQLSITPLGGPANRQARIAADNILGANVPYEGSIATAIAKVFDITVATAGMTGKALRRINKPYLSAIVHPFSHATYYPDAKQMCVKITFAPDSGLLYGAQIVGEAGVDKRIDQFAYAIKCGSTVYDLAKQEPAYAPPYALAKDAIAVARNVAVNILTGTMKPLYWRELRDIYITGDYLIDVRTSQEFETGSLPGAVNIPLDELRDRICEVPQDRPIDVFCSVGLRGYLASRILTLNGFDKVRNLVGGLKIFKAATAPIIIKESYD